MFPVNYSAMQTNEPLASYRKVCLGKIEVKIIDPFSGNPSAVILKGDPKNSATKIEDITVDVWSDKEMVYFKRMNKGMFEKGFLVEIDRSKERVEDADIRSLNSLTDAGLKDISDMPYMGFKHSINRITAVPTLMRLLDIVKEADKSVRFIKAVEQRLAEVQMEE